MSCNVFLIETETLGQTHHISQRASCYKTFYSCNNYGATTLSLMTFSIIILSITINKKISVSIMTLSIMQGCYSEYRLCWVLFMQSVTYKPLMLNGIMLNVFMLSVMAPQILKCRELVRLLPPAKHHPSLTFAFKNRGLNHKA